MLNVPESMIIKTILSILKTILSIKKEGSYRTGWKSKSIIMKSQIEAKSY